MSALLEVSDLRMRYGQFVALHGVDVTVNTGEIVSVIGANGAGKSSLIKAICGTGTREGIIRLGGHDITALPPSKVMRLGIGLVPEGRRLFPSLTVRENIIVGGQIGQSGPWTFERVLRLFPDLEEKLDLPGTSISGGQQQMVAIGRALMTNPRLLLCDEISLGLAPTIINRLYTLLKELVAEGLSIMVVEQAVHKSLDISDRFYCMLEGRIPLSGASATANRDQVISTYFGRDT